MQMHIFEIYLYYKLNTEWILTDITNVHWKLKAYLPDMWGIKEKGSPSFKHLKYVDCQHYECSLSPKLNTNFKKFDSIQMHFIHKAEFGTKY